jgi:hypothetical protein
MTFNRLYKLILESSHNIDDVYIELAKEPKNNKDTLQRMVDEAARAAGYDVKGYHGTDADFVEFSPSDSNRYSGGYYFGKTKNDLAVETRGGRIIGAFLRLKNPITFSHGFKTVAEMQSRGYDGVIDSQEIVVFDPNQIKSADPITYDDVGNIIPLSQRFNSTKDDIRY